MIAVPDWASFPNFSEAEFRCPCGCGRADMDGGFLARLQGLRHEYGRPLRVTSGFRCPARNRAVSATGPEGPHTTGRAIDIAAAGPEALRLLELALRHAFTGFGLQQKGAGRFVHLDDLESAADRPRPTIWTY